MRALFSGVTGIRSHQVRMDVIGNNIANVNTTGFKSSRVTFQDVFSQTMSAGSAQTTPQQIGLGVGIGSTDLDMGAGSLQMTGRQLDLSIEGQGLFVLKGPDGTSVYSRAGNFDWDSEGFLVNPANGSRVQGWKADANGKIVNPNSSGLTDIQMIRGAVSLAKQTGSVTVGGNLDAGATADPTVDEYSTTFTAYDSLGNPHALNLQFNKTSTNNWDWSVSGPAGVTVTPTSTTSFVFNTDGTMQSGQTGTLSLTAPGAGAQTITLDFTTVTQAFAGTSGSSVLVRKVDGYPLGTLESVSIDSTGIVFGVFSNGFRRNLAQVALADFANAGGLRKVGGSAFAESSSSGAPQVGRPSTGGRGRLVSGNLEMSNVDLSTEFTNMIMTQRGFQANTRIISAADEMIQDLVNLRR